MWIMMLGFEHLHQQTRRPELSFDGVWPAERVRLTVAGRAHGPRARRALSERGMHASGPSRGGLHTTDALLYTIRVAIQDTQTLLRRQQRPSSRSLEQQLRSVEAELSSTKEVLQASRSARERHYYKVVAKLGAGDYVSVFDGQTRFRIGERIERVPCVGRRGAFFVYSDLGDATRALHGGGGGGGTRAVNGRDNPSFPVCSKLLEAPRALLRVSSELRHDRTAHGKCVLWSLTPIAEVAVAVRGPRSPSGTRARPATSVRWRI